MAAPSATSWRGSRAALIVFVVWLAVSGVVLLWIGWGFWTPVDDWMLTGTRSFSDPMSLLRDHNQHLSLVPVVIYKAMFSVFGFSSYLPYRAFSVAVHLILVVQLRVIMRQAGVGPWIATAVAGSFTLFASGQLSTAQFQMPLGIVFGLAMVIMVSRPALSMPGCIVAALLGLLAVSTSGVAIGLVVVAGIVAWRRQGLAPAVAMTVPLAIVYITWWLWERPDRGLGDLPVGERVSVLAWLKAYVPAVAGGLAGTSVVQAVMFVAVMAGLVLVIRSRPRGQALLVPAVLAASSVFLLGSTYLGRGAFPLIVQDRFTYLLAALLLPLLGVAWAGLASWNAWAGAAIAVPLAWSMVLNVQHLQASADEWRTYSAWMYQRTASIIYSPAGPSTPDDVRPWWRSPFMGLGATDWRYLREARDSGRLNLQNAPLPEGLVSYGIVRLRVVQTEAAVAQGTCRPHTGAHHMQLRPGASLGFRGGAAPEFAWLGESQITIGLQRAPDTPTEFVAGSDGGMLEIVGDDPVTGKPLQVVVSGQSPDSTYWLCS